MPVTAQNNDYFKNLIAEIVKKHAVLYGPQIAVSKAAEIEGLEVSSEGEIKQVTGDSEYILRQLLAGYMDLSTHITKTVFLQILENYPEDTKKHFAFLSENQDMERF
ncbi:MAG TPA: hypothetical protein VJ065_00240 [Patescibacteria group bacterium]|nr:hypothetical protein [Patescibacteria group bacterium]